LLNQKKLVKTPEALDAALLGEDELPVFARRITDISKASEGGATWT
jgi:hypothetical protein